MTLPPNNKISLSSPYFPFNYSLFHSLPSNQTIENNFIPFPFSLSSILIPSNQTTKSPYHPLCFPLPISFPSYFPQTKQSLKCTLSLVKVFVPLLSFKIYTYSNEAIICKSSQFLPYYTIKKKRKIVSQIRNFYSSC